MVIYQCECGKKYRLSDDKAGAKVRCKHCGRSGIVPHAAPEQPPHRRVHTAFALDRGTLAWLITGAAIVICIVLVVAAYIVSYARRPDHPRIAKKDRTAGSTAKASITAPSTRDATGRAQEHGAGRLTKAPRKDASGGKRASLTAEQLFAQAAPAVVLVTVRDTTFRLIGQGSGFFVSQDGLLATNHHVIEGAHFAGVTLTDGSVHFVDGIAAVDAAADLALLKVHGSGFRSLSMSTRAPPQVGAKVFAVGSPHGLTNTLSEGLVSGHRVIDEGIKLIQTTAAASPGSSGGPLLSATGKVVGVITGALSSGQNLNFAVPADKLSRLIAKRGKLKPLASAGGQSLTRVEARGLNGVWKNIQAGEYGKALGLLSEIRGSQESSPSYWFAIGYVHSQLGNQELALDAWRTVLKLDPQNALAHYNIGVAYMKARSYREALASYVTVHGAGCWRRLS